MSKITGAGGRHDAESDGDAGSTEDKARRDHFVATVIRQGLAIQIRETRLSRGWTQEELARRIGTSQETISQLEDPNYGRYTLKTLRRLAAAFDVALTCRFVPFSELSDWVTTMSPESLAVPDFDHDPGTTPKVTVTL